MPKNAKKEAGKLSEVKSKIQAAMKKIGAQVTTEDADDTATTTMSANKQNAQPYTNIMTENKTKILAAQEIDEKEGETDSAKVLFAFLGEFMKAHPEFMEQLTKKSTTEEGGLKQWSAKVETIENEVKTFKAEQIERQAQAEKQALIDQATREGKVVNLSVSKRLDLEGLKEYVSTLEKVVPMKSKMKILSATGDNKPSKAKAIEAFNAMLNK